MCWGDFWVKHELVKAFRKLGCNASLGGVFPHHADLTVYLWGNKFPSRHNWPFLYNYSSHNFNMAWFYSHPEIMDKAELRKYDFAFCLSEQYLPAFNSMATKITETANYPLLSCTSFSAPKPVPIKDIDILFVGNARGGSINAKGRTCISWLDVPNSYRVKIYGHKWHDTQRFGWLHRKGWYAGQYFDYRKLNHLYASSKIVLIDGHKDMQTHGFVQMKIYDALASGAFVLSEHNSAIQSVFGEFVPTFKDADEMNRLIRIYMSNPALRNKMIQGGKRIAMKNRYINRAQLMLQEYERHKDKVRASCV